MNCGQHGNHGLMELWSKVNDQWSEGWVSLLQFWVSLHQWVVFSELRGGNDQKIFARQVLLFHFKLDHQLMINESNIGSLFNCWIWVDSSAYHCIIGLLSWHSYSSQKYMVLGQLKIPLRSAEYCNPFSCVFRSTTIVNDLISWILYSRSF